MIKAKIINFLKEEIKCIYCKNNTSFNESYESDIIYNICNCELYCIKIYQKRYSYLDCFVFYIKDIFSIEAEMFEMSNGLKFQITSIATVYKSLVNDFSKEISEIYSLKEFIDKLNEMQSSILKYKNNEIFL
jgi:hypothetical protein